MAEAMASLQEAATAPSRVHLTLVLEAWCDLVAEAEEWDQASEVLATTREQVERGAFLALPLFADRLEGRAALAGGDAERAAGLLRQARDGFLGLEARWEAAVTDVSLVEALLLAGRREEAAEVLSGALAVFDDLHSVRELERARELLAELA
jgi:hypothetical protein